MNAATSICTVRFKMLVGMLVLLTCICLAADRVWAVSGVGDPPVYNPATKSYFQLLKLKGQDHRWPAAREVAQAQVYRGVKGRLAVIDREETHQFIMQNFDVSGEIWVGLRYWCKFRMLEWAGQRPYSPSDPERFHAWHTPWSRNNQHCPPNVDGPEAFMGVYYQPLGRQSARWQAVRKGKGFGRLLVEYPTGEE